MTRKPPPSGRIPTFRRTLDRWEPLISRYASEVFFAHRRYGDAEDVAQDLRVTLLMYLQEYYRKNRRIMHPKLIKTVLVRRKLKLVRGTRVALYENRVMLPNIDEMICTEDPDQHTIVMAEDDRQRQMQIITLLRSKMEPGEFGVLWLRYAEGYSLGEIAEWQGHGDNRKASYQARSYKDKASRILKAAGIVLDEEAL